VTCNEPGYHPGGSKNISNNFMLLKLENKHWPMGNLVHMQISPSHMIFHMSLGAGHNLLFCPI